MQDKAARRVIADLRRSVARLAEGAAARQAMADLEPAVRSRDYGDHGYVADLERPDPACVALKLCRNGADSLAARMRPVPEGYLHEAYVECRCGTGNARRRLFECAGGCGRWFMADDAGVWAARLDA
jgi:hypothetical protein